MSFFISFNGQFSPYIHPTVDAWNAKVVPIQKIERMNSQAIDHQHHELTGNPHTPKPNVSAYQQQVKTFEKSKKRVYAKDLMKSPVHFALNKSLASEAIALMKKFGFRHLPIYDSSNNLVGLLSDRELIGSNEKSLCEDLMIPKVLVALQTARIQEIAHIMLDEKINSLPIVDDNHVVTGIITQSDILRFVIASDNFTGLG
jgi:CBS domain-containing protein